MEIYEGLLGFSWSCFTLHSKSSEIDVLGVEFQVLLGNFGGDHSASRQWQGQSNRAEAVVFEGMEFNKKVLQNLVRT